MFCCPRMWCAISVHLWPMELLLRLFARDGIAVAPAVYEEQLQTPKELYTDLTDATDFSGKATRVFRVHPCTKTTMTDIVIQAENLGKKYTIGHQAADGRYLALRDVLAQNARVAHHGRPAAMTRIRISESMGLKSPKFAKGKSDHA